ncbi:MAG: hypothetical protein JWQ48_2576 [Conexibacter sp.]|jgi:ribose/xylose/arabinose/galactoside ABC-type transport system permease subunit|nr:hypothetical protein [Conexibacter sp.]
MAIEPSSSPAGDLGGDRADAGATDATAPAAPLVDRRAQRAALLGRIGVPLILVLMIVVFALTAQDFLAGSNIKTIFTDAAFPSMVAIGLTVCLTMGEFDLSLNGVAGLATIVVSVLVARNHMATIPAILITLATVGVVVGLANGLLVGYLGLNALIVTIAVNSGLLGFEYVISKSQQIFGGYPRGFVSFARGSVGPIPNIVILAVVLAIAVWLMLERTTLGRQMRAVGGNAEAARIAGVNVSRTKVWGFIICSLLTAVAGVLFAGKQTAAFPLSGLDVLLPSYAACFIGAATFKVGEFNIAGTLVGVMIATITANGLLLIGVANYATYLIQGAILLVALTFARLVARRRAAA